jgi:hypothetical protein
VFLLELPLALHYLAQATAAEVVHKARGDLKTARDSRELKLRIARRAGELTMQIELFSDRVRMIKADRSQP